MNWTIVLANGVAFCTILVFVWKAYQKIGKAIREMVQSIQDSAIAQAKAAQAQAEAQAKSKADKQRTEVLWGIVELQGELIAEIQDHLAKPPKEREAAEFHVRRTTANLQKKATDRLNSLHTDFT